MRKLYYSRYVFSTDLNQMSAHECSPRSALQVLFKRVCFVLIMKINTDNEPYRKPVSSGDNFPCSMFIYPLC